MIPFLTEIVELGVALLVLAQANSVFKKTQIVEGAPLLKERLRPIGQKSFGRCTHEVFA
jgi:hypothetical protein